MSRGDFNLERTGERGTLSRGDLESECTDEIDKGDDPWPTGDGLCGAEARPVVAPSSWLGVGEDIPGGSTTSVCRTGGGVGASDEASKRLDNPSSIGDGIDPELGESRRDVTLGLADALVFDDLDGLAFGGGGAGSSGFEARAADFDTADFFDIFETLETTDCTGAALEEEAISPSEGAVEDNVDSHR